MVDETRGVPERGVRVAASLLAALAVASTFISPARRDLFFGEESRYARIAHEMHDAGEWLVPTIDGRPYTDKPPLHFDAVIAIAHGLGFHETWTYVLPSLLSFVALTLLVAALGRRWLGPEVAAVAAFVFATFVLAWGSAQTARMDLEYALLGALAAAFLYEAIGGRPRLILWSGLATGVAVLVKGPALAVIMMLLFAAESLRRRRRPRWEDAAALVIACAIPAAWVWRVAAIEGHWAAFDLVVTQNLGRAVASFAHAKPAWFYLANFPLLFFPWFVLLIMALASRRVRRSDPLAFCALWFGAIFLFFSAISGKLEVYLVPALVPAALMVGGWVAPLRREGARPAWVANLALLVGAAIPLLAAIVIASGRPDASRSIAVVGSPPFRGVVWVGAAAALLAALLHALPSLRVPSRSVLVTGSALLVAPVAAAMLLIGWVNETYSSEPLLRLLDREGLDRASVVVYDGFHPWGRGWEFGAVDRIREADPWILKRATVLPDVVVTRASRATELGPPLRTRYVKIASIMLRRNEYDVFRLRP